MVVPCMFAAHRVENQKLMENNDACSSMFQGGELRHHGTTQPPPVPASNAGDGWMKPGAGTHTQICCRTVELHAVLQLLNWMKHGSRFPVCCSRSE
jgi:hypothetical protein